MPFLLREYGGTKHASADLCLEKKASGGSRKVRRPLCGKGKAGESQTRTATEQCANVRQLRKAVRIK